MSENAPLQFDTAEFQTQSQPSACAVCRIPLVREHYTAGSSTVCERCRTNLQTAVDGGGARRMLGAVALGGLAAFFGALAYALLTFLTRRQFAIVSIALGYVVGAAVRLGSSRRGGWKYQLLAVVLTYGSIGTALVLAATIELVQEQDSKGSTPNAFTKLMHSETESQPASSATSQPEIPKELGPAMAQLGLLLGEIFLVLIAMAFSVPVLAIGESPLLLVIIGFALLQAWRLNKGERLDFAGPFQIGGPPPP